MSFTNGLVDYNISQYQFDVWYCFSTTELRHPSKRVLQSYFEILPRVIRVRMEKVNRRIYRKLNKLTNRNSDPSFDNMFNPESMMTIKMKHKR